jgi:hypothetical protein
LGQIFQFKNLILILSNYMQLFEKEECNISKVKILTKHWDGVDS